MPFSPWLLPSTKFLQGVNSVKLKYTVIDHWNYMDKGCIFHTIDNKVTTKKYNSFTSTHAATFGAYASK